MPLLAPSKSKRGPSYRAQKATSIGEVDFENDDSILSFVQGRWDSRDQYRMKFEEEWFTCIMFCLGYQYHVWDPRGGKMYLPDAPSYRVRLVANRLMPIVRKAVAKALRQRPVLTSLPATDDAEDAMVAQVGTKMLQYYWRFLEADVKSISAYNWLFMTGNVFFRTYWDPQAGQEFGLDQDDAELLGPEAMRGAPQKLATGDVCLEVVSPFEVDPDPNADCIENCSFLIHSKVRSLDYLKARYPKTANEIEADADSETSLTRFFEKRLATVGGNSGFGPDKDKSEDENSCQCHQLWVAPNGKYLKGAYAFVAGGKVLKKLTELPNPFKRIPYVMIREIVVPGRFWGTSAVKLCLPLQSDYNKARSQVVEYRNLCIKPKWLCATNSGVKDFQLTSMPGEKIFYRWPMKPELSQPPPLPQDIYEGMNLSLRDIEDISSVHEVTQARAPSSIRTGVAIAQLQEADDQTLAPVFLYAERAFSKLGQWVLQLLADNCTEERVIRIVGKDKEVESFAFTGGQLYGPNSEKPGVFYFDVECQIESQLPHSRAARAQFILDLVREGIFDRVADKKRIMKSLSLGTDEPAIEDEALDRQRALRENILLMNGKMVATNPWDDDLIHIETHRRYQKHPDFMKNAQPDAIQRFEQHIAIHAIKASGGQVPPAMQVNLGLTGADQSGAPMAGLTEPGLPEEPPADLPMEGEEGMVEAPPALPMPGGF
jgi:hypothetical protein